MLRVTDRETPDTLPLTMIVKGHEGWLEVERLQRIVAPLMIDVPLTGGVVQVTPDAKQPGGQAALLRGLHDTAAVESPGRDAAPGPPTRAHHEAPSRFAAAQDDLCDRVHIAELIDLLRRTCPALPDDACIVANGTFMPADGRARRRFIAYADSAFPPCVALPADGPKRLTLTAFLEAARRATGILSPLPLRVAPRRVLGAAPDSRGAAPGAVGSRLHRTG